MSQSLSFASSSKKPVAILAAGFGPRQSEITETICLILALSEIQIPFQIFALDTQFTLNHHVVKPAQDLNSKNFDALALPGGYGVGSLMSSWHEEGLKFKVTPIVEEIIKNFHHDSSPIGAICMAPLLLSKVLSAYNPCLTLGLEFEHTATLEKWGTQLELCPSHDFISDRHNKLISTPAYMNANVSPYEVYSGIRAMTKELVEMA